MFSVVVFASLMGMVMADTDNLPEYRLPGNVIPNKYVLEVTVDVCNKNYKGVVYIEISCLKSTSTITLHSKGLKIGPEVHISEGAQSGNRVKCTFVLNDKDDFLIITVPKQLEVGVSYTLNIPYEGDLNQKDEGLYLYEPTSPSEDQHSWYVATNVMTRARFFFPCFDEPAMRATFTLKVQHHKSLKAISTMRAVNEEELIQKSISRIMSLIKKPFKTESTMESMCRNDPSNMVWEEFHETPWMSTHKLGLVVAKLTMMELQGIGRLWSLKHKPMQATTSMFKLIPKMHNFFANNFDLYLPLDVIVFENTKFLSFSGAIIVPEEMVLPEKIYLTKAQVIAHGIASQWTDGIVCMKWWSDFWFTWALAEYMATRALDFILRSPTLKAGYGNIINYYRLQEVYKQNEKNDRRVYTIINRPEEIYEHIATIAFTQKGPLLLRMLQFYVGDLEFRNSVVSFFGPLRSTRKCVDHTDFWKSFTFSPKVGEVPKGMTVEKFMHGWITQTGFPVVTLTRKYDGSKVHIYASQRPYRKSTEHEKDSSEKCWPVQLSILSSKIYEGQSQLQQHNTLPKLYTTWLTCEEREKELTDFPGEDFWYIANPQLAGLYKVKHDADNWKLLAVALYKPVQSNIGELNRAELIEEVLDATRNGEIYHRVAFDILRSFKYELSYLPWKAARPGIKFLKQELSRQNGYELFKSFISQIVTPIFNSYRGISATIHFEEAMLSDVMKWACEFDYKTCREEAYKLFDSYMKWKQSPRGKPNPVPSHFRRVVYCNGLNRGHEQDYQKMMEFLERSEDDEQEKKNMAFGLSCIPSEDILKGYLEKTIDTNNLFPKDLSTYAFRKVVANDNGFNVALKFIDENSRHDKSNPFVISHIADYIIHLALRAKSTEELIQVKGLFRENVLPNEVQEAYKLSEAHIAWLQENLDSLKEAVRLAENSLSQDDKRY